MSSMAHYEKIPGYKETRTLVENIVGMEAAYERLPGQFVKGYVMEHRTGDVNFIRIDAGDVVYLADPRKVYVKAESAA